MDSIRIKAPAKINLCLNVKGRREDGYHELETVMQTIDLYDYLDITPAKGFSFSCSDGSLSQNNLVEKAAYAFYGKLGRPAAVHIHLEKHIPHGAGLGGGSSDAAATLIALNKLHNEPFAYEDLRQMAANMGADVAFFLTGGTALCSGIGDVVEPMPGFPLGCYLLVKPAFGIATSQIYTQLDTKALKKSPSLSKIAPLITSQSNISSMLNNDLESVAVALYPELAKIKEELYAHGSGGVLVSGSGSTVFGLFANKNECGRAAHLLKTQQHNSWWITACLGTNADL